MRRFILIIFVFTVFSALTNALTFPEKTNFVNDFTATLSQTTVEQLNTRLKNYEIETGNEIAIAIIKSTEGKPIAMYATELGNAWGVGKAKVDNGALLLIAKEDRELFIATGSQLEGALTDIEANDIVDYVITPRFKSGNFDEGVTLGIEGMIGAIKGESFTELRMEGAEKTSAQMNYGNIIFFLIFFVFPWLGAVLGRSKAIWPGAVIGGAGGGIGALLLSFALWGIIASAVGLTLLGLFFDWFVSKNYQKSIAKGGVLPWWIGGGRGGRGGFGGGFGGFGGGGFSGGGSGGSW